MVNKQRAAATEIEHEKKRDGGLAEVFGDPMLIKSTEDDPILRYLSGAWKQILTTFVGCAALFYIVNTFMATQENSQRASGDLFLQVQNDFSSLRAMYDSSANLTEESAKAEREKEIKDLRTRLEQSITALGDAKSPYPKLAALYRGLMLSLTGDFEGATRTLSSVSAESSGADGIEKLISELATLASARIRLGMPEQRAAALAEIEKVVGGSEYTRSAAAISAAMIASGDEERKKALELLNKVIAAQPEQSSILESQIKRLE